MTIHYTTNQTRFTFSLIHLKQVTSAPWTKTGLPKRKNFQRPRNNGMRCEGTVRNSRSQRMFLVLMCNLLRKFTNVCIGFIGYQFFWGSRGRLQTSWQEDPPLEVKLLSAATGDTLLRLPRVQRSCQLGLLKAGIASNQVWFPLPKNYLYGLQTQRLISEALGVEISLMKLKKCFFWSEYIYIYIHIPVPFEFIIVYIIYIKGYHFGQKPVELFPWQEMIEAALRIPRPAQRLLWETQELKEEIWKICFQCETSMISIKSWHCRMVNLCVCFFFCVCLINE